GDGCPGCGTILGLKLLLQSLDNIVLVNATGSVTPFIKVDVPFIHAGLNAAAVARGVARSLDKKAGTKVVVYAGDGTTAASIASLINSTEDIIYVCANDQSQNQLGSSYATQLSHNANYTATACVAYPQDYITKLKKAAAMPGFKFIDLLCPCPVVWGYEASNTMEIGRVAVETGVWPLYEIENSTANLTKRPNRLEPLEHFTQAQKKLVIKSGVQEKINKNWKLLTEGRVP
ncbi:MAG: thiamine pyrophosphate-dependent enzyme, partial [Candidatus Aenigmatarchaeota archaeon]